MFLPNEHEPWELHAAELLDLDDELVAAAGLPGVDGSAHRTRCCSRRASDRFGRG